MIDEGQRAEWNRGALLKGTGLVESFVVCSEGVSPADSPSSHRPGTFTFLAVFVLCAPRRRERRVARATPTDGSNWIPSDRKLVDEPRRRAMRIDLRGDLACPRSAARRCVTVR